MARNEIWRMPYTKDQLQNAVTNQVPVIGNNGNWWRWDIAPQKFVDTGTPANTAGISPYQITGRNLLDNWDFRNPVDQRGGYVVPPGTAVYRISDHAAVGTTTNYMPVTLTPYQGYTVPMIEWEGSNTDYWAEWGSQIRGYTGTGDTIDRWAINNAILLIEPDGITIKSDGSGDSHFFYISGSEMLPPSQYILSILVASLDGTCGMSDGVSEQTLLTVGLNSLPFYFSATSAVVRNIYPVNYLNGTIKIRAAKLELGTEQTLAHQDESGNWVLNDPPPDYGEELAKCQRYQMVYKLQQYNTQFVAVGISETAARIDISLPAQLRTRPALHFLAGDASDYALYSGSESINLTGMTVYSVAGNNVTLHCTAASGISAGRAYQVLRSANSDVAFILDANL